MESNELFKYQMNEKEWDEKMEGESNVQNVVPIFTNIDAIKGKSSQARVNFLLALMVRGEETFLNFESRIPRSSILHRKVVVDSLPARPLGNVPIFVYAFPPIPLPC